MSSARVLFVRTRLKNWTPFDATTHAARTRFRCTLRTCIPIMINTADKARPSGNTIDDDNFIYTCRLSRMFPETRLSVLPSRCHGKSYSRRGNSNNLKFNFTYFA